MYYERKYSSTDRLRPCEQRARTAGFLRRTPLPFFSPPGRSRNVISFHKGHVTGCDGHRMSCQIPPKSGENERNVPESMLNPLLGRSRRHLVAFIHPSSLSQHPALSLGSGHALSPPPHAREQHHHYRKWQLAGGDGRTGDAPSGLRSTSRRPAAKRR